MKAGRIAAAIVCCMAAAVMAGCRVLEPATDAGTTSAAPSAQGTTADGTQDTAPSGTAPDTAPSSAAPVYPPYTAPSPMPPKSGTSALEGRMLWPVQQDMSADENYGIGTYKYGFINEKGKKVIPAEYTQFWYEMDESGRYAYVVLLDGRRTDFYTMDGRLALSVPALEAWTVSGTNAIYAVLDRGDYVSESISTERRVTLYDVASGERLLKNDYVNIYVLNSQYAVLIDTSLNTYLYEFLRGEGERIRMEGYYNFNASWWRDGGELLIGASDVMPYQYDGQERDCKYGYLGTDGKWAIEPAFADVGEFKGDYAGVRMEDGFYRFIDRSGRVVGAEAYEYINTYVNDDGPGAMYEVYISNQRFVLDKDLQVYQPPETEPENGWHDGVYYYDGKTIDALPEGYTHISYSGWPVLIAYNQQNRNYFVNMETGEGRQLEKRYDYFLKAAGYYIGCKYDESGDVFDENGHIVTGTAFDLYPSAFTHLNSMMSTAEEQYLWVTTARYQGYVDGAGKWLYRESRYGSLMD